MERSAEKMGRGQGKMGRPPQTIEHRQTVRAPELGVSKMNGGPGPFLQTRDIWRLASSGKNSF